MRIRSMIPALILAVLSSACSDPRPKVVLVHASDPHLLDGKRPRQEPLNRAAFATMIDTLRRGAAGTMPPRYLVVTGDWGLEVTDPRYVATPANSPAAFDTARARQRFTELVDTVATRIRGGPFRRVFFVPGNNDVLLEDARDSAWSEIPRFVAAVQEALGSKERFVDLTACYHPGQPDLRACYARLDSPYVLVGFPSISFKNAGIDTAEYRMFRGEITGEDSVPYPAAMDWREHRQDTLHLRLLRRFQDVLRVATSHGWRALVVTHIPDLDDPFAVGQQIAGEGAPARPRLARGREAWNVSDEVARGWRAAVESDQVLGVLAGHFHDSHRGIYYRPYRWSRGERQANPWKTFVTPPLAIKSQESSPAHARGFTVLTVQDNAVRRRFHWLSQSGRYEADPGDEYAPPAENERRDRFNPVRSASHGIVFMIVLLTAGLAAALWRSAAAAPSAGKRARGPHTWGWWWNALRAFGLALAVGALVILTIQLAWGLEREIWFVAAFWTAALFALMILFAAAIAPMLLPHDPRDERDHA
jgi:hypothetical protein